MPNTYIIAEGKLVVRNFGVDNTGLFVYDKENGAIALQLPTDSHNKTYKVIIEEIEHGSN